MAQDPFAGANGNPDGDPFDKPAEIPSEYPKLEGLRGRLLMWAPTKYEPNIPSRFKDSNGVVQLQNRMTADLYVVDGGPVPGFPVTAFSSMYVSNGRLVDQMMKAFRGQSMVLGRLDTKDGGTSKAGAGNPWGLSDPTEEDKNLARAYIAAGNRQPGEGPDGFPQAPAQPQFAPPGAAPTPPWGATAATTPTPPWGSVPAATPMPPWGQQPAAAAPNPWG